MKKCSTCKVEKQILDFHKNARSKYGLCNRCKYCDNEYKKSSVTLATRRTRYAEKGEIGKEFRRLYVRANRPKFNGYQKTYADKNREKIREMNNKSYNSAGQRHKNNARAAKRRAYKAKATFKGYDSQLQEIYKNCPKGYHVDHIVPLFGKEVCGLHVPWNLQYLPALKNLQKGNKTILKELGD